MTARIRNTPAAGHRPVGTFGVLLSNDAYVYGRFTSRLLAAVAARHVITNQPDVEFEVMETSKHGWRSEDGRSPEQVFNERWTA